MIEPWPLGQPRRWRTMRTVSGRGITVPSGFSTDGASIPRWLWSVIGAPWDARYARAAIVHDFLYVQRGATKRNRYTRRDADRIFYEIMLDDGVPKWRAWAMWSGVRAGGWIGWNAG